MKYGLIGLGAISKFYSKAAEIVAVCDINEAKLEGFKGFRTTKLDELLKADIDAVIVCTPNSTHEQIVRKCIEAGKHVLCEKPLTISALTVGPLIDFAERKGVKLMTAYHRRYNENFIHLQQILRKRKISHVRIRYLENISDHSNGEQWYMQNWNGFGCVTDNGVNAIDIAMELLGDIVPEQSIIDRVSSVPQSALLRFSKEGVSGEIELDWRSEGEAKDVVVFTSSGERYSCDFLKGFKRFKGSLWHEYENIIKDFERMPVDYKDTRTLKIMRFHDQVLKK